MDVCVGWIVGVHGVMSVARLVAPNGCVVVEWAR